VASVGRDSPRLIAPIAVAKSDSWLEPAAATKLGLRVEIPELGGLWEIVEIYPYRLTDEQLKTHMTPS
jgi:hypothetical protein